MLLFFFCFVRLLACVHRQHNPTRTKMVPVIYQRWRRQTTATMWEPFSRTAHDTAPKHIPCAVELGTRALFNSRPRSRPGWSYTVCGVCSPGMKPQQRHRDHHEQRPQPGSRGVNGMNLTTCTGRRWNGMILACRLRCSGEPRQLYLLLCPVASSSVEGRHHPPSERTVIQRTQQQSACRKKSLQLVLITIVRGTPN